MIDRVMIYAGYIVVYKTWQYKKKKQKKKQCSDIYCQLSR